MEALRHLSLQDLLLRNERLSETLYGANGGNDKAAIQQATWEYHATARLIQERTEDIYGPGASRQLERMSSKELEADSRRLHEALNEALNTNNEEKARDILTLYHQIQWTINDLHQHGALMPALVGLADVRSVTPSPALAAMTLPQLRIEEGRLRALHEPPPVNSTKCDRKESLILELQATLEIQRRNAIAQDPQLSSTASPKYFTGPTPLAGLDFNQLCEERRIRKQAVYTALDGSDDTEIARAFSWYHNIQNVIIGRGRSEANPFICRMPTSTTSDGITITELVRRFTEGDAIVDTMTKQQLLQAWTFVSAHMEDAIERHDIPLLDQLQDIQLQIGFKIARIATPDQWSN
jgi:hypothetical protein